ncbi:MAG: oxidoreductase domain protein [Bacilli bacterium]|nr:oxidoreductase domain protein [Bacilli bacterium]
MGDVLKIGVIGAGSISDLHLQSILRQPRAEVWAISDLNETRAQEKAVKFGASHVYIDYKKMLDDPHLDAVIISVMTKLHAEMAIAVLDAGKHLLMEKPLCLDMDEARRIEAAVKRSGKSFLLGYVRRFDPCAQIAQQFIANGDLGQIYYAKASRIHRIGNPGGWYANKEFSGGGPLIDIGGHSIDLAWYLMGRPIVQSISANTYNRLGTRHNIRNLSYYKAADASNISSNVEDMANALIRFDNGASMSVEVSYSLHARQNSMDLQLYGDKGGCEIDPELRFISEKYDTILNITPQVDRLSFDVERAFQNEMDHFVACCLDGEKSIIPIEDGLEMMRILTGIYESAAQGKEIYL